MMTFRNRKMLLALCLGFLLGPAACADEPAATRVVLITLDTLRFDHLDSDAESTSAMPLLRVRASRGLLFSRFYASSPVTQPAHASFFTGMQPWEHGVTRNGVILPGGLPSVIDDLQRSGYATAAVVASFPLASRFGFARGFDEFTERFDLSLNAERPVWEGRWKIPGGEFFSPADQITDRALEQLDSARGDKQFFWFHYFDPHSPYGSSGGGGLIKSDVLKAMHESAANDAVDARMQRVRAGYASDVSFLDAQLDLLMKRLETDSQRFTTHIVIVADHGESLGEHGRLGHGNALTEEQLRVPAVILSPGVEPGRRADVAGSIDIARTLLSLAGVQPTDTRVGGRDLTADGKAKGAAFAIRRSFARGSGRDRLLDGRMLELSGHLYAEIAPSGEIVTGSATELDSTESLSSLDADGRRRIAERFRSFEERLASSSAAEDLDAETLRALRELGYIQ